MVPLLDIRRHAQRQSLDDQQSALSTAGRAMCEALAKTAPKYALVVSSPLPRAKETAQRIAGRLDSADPALLPDLGTYASSIFGEMRMLADWARLLRENAEGRAFAEQQPVSLIVNAVRGLLLNQPDVATIGQALAWCVGILVVFIPLSVWAYGRRTAR